MHFVLLTSAAQQILALSTQDVCSCGWAGRAGAASSIPGKIHGDFVSQLPNSVTQFLIGVFTNGFILVVNAVDLIKQRQMAPLDLLISCLLVLAELYIIFMFVNILGLWLATWLGVFYCTKISTIPHPLFFWLKMRISKLVPWLILASTLYASISTGIQAKLAWTIIQKLVVKVFSKNATQAKEMNLVPHSVLIFHLILPLFIFLLAILLLIFSLGKHAQQMKSTAMGNRHPIRGAPIRAMLSILSFLILYSTHYMMVIFFSFKVLQFGSFLFEFCIFVAGIYPCIHSVILILGNPKLKENAKKFLWSVWSVRRICSSR
ncbi:PREDICTED: taste receptor type 2 member 1-like [Chinchilla lanigera]|uniref:taste receptor type 2 member 1-like n=1 Tax=Chinchilla lanigera TaxID=34839 RepID=UPI0006971818|nr:PREDICTED: taste receptor type 2 member 1-like [Chinchilla lanigera]